MKISSRGKPGLRAKQEKKNEQSNPLFRDSPLPMWIYDAETSRFLDVNRAAVEHYGYSRREFLSMCLSDILAETDVSPKTGRARSARRGFKTSGKTTHCRKDGSGIVVEVTNQNWMFGGRKAVLSMMREVSNHKHINEVKQTQLAEFHSLVANAMDAIIMVDERQNITAFNSSAEKMFQRTASEVMGKPLNLLIPNRFHHNHEKHVEAFIRHGVTQRSPGHLSRLLALRADGTEFPVEISISSTQVDGQKHVTAAIRDITEQQRAEDELRRAEENYRALVEQLPMMVYRNSVSDISLTTYISPQVETILGYTPEEWVADLGFWEKALRPEDHDRVMAEVHRAHRTGQPFDIEYRIMARDGRTVWFRDQAALIRDPEGHPLFWQGLMVDITKSRAAQQALSESEDRYRDLVESSRVLICTHDLQGRVLSVNPWAAHLVGYEEKDLIGKNLRDILIPEQKAGLDKYLAVIRRKGFASGLMTVMIASGEKRVWEYHNTLRTEGVAEPIVRGTAYDITERKQAEETLRFSETMYRGLFDTVLDGIFRTTPDGTILSANPALVRMLGYQTKEQVLALNMRNLYLHPELREHNLARLDESGEIRDREIELKRADDTILVVLENARAVRDSNNKLLFYEGTLTDITERKRAEEALRASEAELQALLDAIPDVILVLDKYGRYLKITPTESNLFYLPDNDLLGKRLHDVFSRQKADEFVKYIQQALQTHKPVRFEYAMLIRDRIMWFSGATAPLTEDSVVWVARDITPQKTAEQQMQRRLDELEALYESGLALSQILDPKEIGRKIIQILSDRLNWHHAAVRLRRENSDEVELLAFSQSDSDHEWTKDDYARANRAVPSVNEGISGWVIENGRIVNSADLEMDSRYHPTFAGMRSGLYVPIWAGGRAIGCISVESSQRKAFQEDDERFLITLASQAAAALENARLFESERRRRLDAETLRKAASVLTSSLNREQILASLLKELVKLIPFGVATVFIAEGDYLTAVAEEGPLVIEELIGHSFPLKDSMQRYVLEKRGPIILADARADPRFHQWNRTIIVRGWLGVPLFIRDEIIGYLAMGSDKPNVFNETHAEMVTAFASHAAAALENARLFDAEQRRRLDAETLRQAASALSSSLDLETILNELLDALANVISYNSATVFIKEHESLRAMAAKGLAVPEDVIGRRFPSNDEVFGLILESRNPVILPDASADRHFKNWGNDKPTLGWMGVPLIARGEIIGCITFDSLTANTYTEADGNMAMTIASHAAIAIENSRLYNDALLAAERRAVLHEVSQEISRLGQDLEQVYGSIHNAASRLMPSEAFTIALLDEEQNEVEGVYLFDRNGRSPSMRIPFGKGFSSRVIASGGTILIADDLDMDVDAVHFGSEERARSILAVPMRVGGKIIGVISAQSYEPNVYGDEDRLLLEMLASQAAVAIENARLYNQINRRMSQLESLNRASQALTGTLELRPLLENILQAASQAIPGAEKGTILLREYGHDHLHMRAQIGYEDARLTDLPFDDSKGYSGRAYRENRPILIRDSKAEYEAPFDEQVQEVNEIRSAIVAPLIIRNEPIGVIALDNASRENAFTEQDLDLLTIFASSAAQVIESSRLFEQTRRRANEFEALYETAAELASQTDLPTLLNSVIERAWTLSGAAGAGLYLFDPERGDLELVAISDPAVHPGIRIALGEGLSGRVAQTKKPMTVNDYQTWENRSSKYEGIPYSSVIAVPMLYSGELVGVLDIYNHAIKDAVEPPPGFSEQDSDLIYLFANAVAGAVYSARLLDQTRQRLNELDTVARVSSALRIASTRAEMAPIILAQLREILHADGALFVTLNPVTNELTDEFAQGSLESIAGLVVPADQGLSTQVIQSRQVYTTANLQDDPRVYAKEKMPHVRSAVIVPLVSQDSALGALWVTRDEKNGIQPAPFADNEISLLVAIADMAANAIQRTRLHEETVAYNERLIIVNRLGRALAETLDLPAIYQRLAQFALDLLPDTAIIYITEFDESKRVVRAVHAIQDGNALNVSGMAEIPLSENEHGAFSHVIQSGEPMIVEDLSEYFSVLKAKPVLVGPSGKRTESALYVPMISEGKVIGVLQAQSYLSNRYTPSDAKLLSLVANTAAVAIQNSRLFAQLKRRLDQLSALHMIDTAINSTTDLRLSLQAVLDSVTRQLRVDAACILLLNPSTLNLQYVAGIGFSTLEVTGTSLALGRDVAGKVALERQMINIPDLAAEDAGVVHHRMAAAEKFVGYCAVPLVAKGEVKGVMELFHRARLDLDDERASFLDMLASQAALAVDNALLFESLEKANIELTMAYDATIEGWSQALELRDQETQGHSARVLDLALQLGAALGLSDRDLHDIRRGVLLHDIGKMGIPDSILHKPGPLTREEWTIMQKHPQYAYDMLAPIAYLRSALDIPYCHHEKWDGSGYPRGLKGETIPLAARLFAVVDVYDALTTDRAYRKAWSREKTIEYIISESGKHFDPAIVDIFLKMIHE
ncbi:MAG: GAF domain-containing protein [Chloroflexi bacterium]|nr:GAF domain-containing protein [Chloroflexota bacterium]